MIKNLLLFFILLPSLLLALPKTKDFPDKPLNYVSDLSGVLSQEQQNSLNQKLKNFEDSTSNQIFVFVDSALGSRDMSQLCQDIFHQWHIGQKGKNNGVLIAVFIKDHKFRIHTGYGLEGALPDLLTNRIQTETMRPYFKQGDYYKGIDAGIDSLIYYCGHEFKAEAQENDQTTALIVFYCVDALALILFFIMLFHKKAIERSTGRKTLLIMMVVVFSLIPLFGGIATFVVCAFISPWKKRGNRRYWSEDSSSWSGSIDSDTSSTSSSSDSSFDGGGGGDSGGGGSSSDW